MDGDQQKIHDVLADKRSFQYMSQTMLLKLISLMKVTRHKKGEVLIKQGEDSIKISIILKGQVSIYVNGKYVYDLKRTGDLFGEISFITSNSATATVRAESELNLVTLTHDILQDIGDTEIYKWLCRVVAEKLIVTSNGKK